MGVLFQRGSIDLSKESSEITDSERLEFSLKVTLEKLLLMLGMTKSSRFSRAVAKNSLSLLWSIYYSQLVYKRNEEFN